MSADFNMSMEEEKTIDVKQTEWDSSLATLMRIDSLLRRLYDCVFAHNYQHYLEVQDLLYQEAQVKMTKDELTQCDEFQKSIIGLKNQYFKELNNKNTQAWIYVNNTARQYQIYLMNCLDNHNMLMRTAKSGMERFRSGAR